MKHDALGRVRKIGHTVTLHFLLIFFSGCAILGPKKTETPIRQASSATFCLAPLMAEAADRTAAARPAVEATKQKLANAEALGIVEVTPLVELAELIFDVAACIEQVNATSSD